MSDVNALQYMWNKLQIPYNIMLSVYESALMHRNALTQKF